MLIIHKIEKTHFSASEAQIIDFILTKGFEIKDMTISQIANMTFTSAPLLIRIAKKLGYSGWNEFKDAYIKELNYLYSSTEIDASIPFVINDTFVNIAQNIAKLEIETIKDTMELLQHDDLFKAMSILRNSKEIDIFGVSNNVILAEEFVEKMFFIDKKVMLCRLTGDPKIQAALSDSSHCAILISYSGQTKFILEVANVLKKKNTPIIAITCVADNDLSKKADVVLKISSREMLHTKIGDFASSQSVKLILDILYGCYFSLDYKTNLDKRISLAREVDDRFSGYEYIDEDKY